MKTPYGDIDPEQVSRVLCLLYDNTKYIEVIRDVALSAGLIFECPLCGDDVVADNECACQAAKRTPFYTPKGDT